jgi:hypothetical protein
VEVCLALLLTTKRHVIAVHEIGRGTIDSCPVSPREVLTAALFANAAGVIVAHNHPSGDPTPSSDDFALCSRLRAAADLVGVQLVDFLIVGAGSTSILRASGIRATRDAWNARCRPSATMARRPAAHALEDARTHATPWWGEEQSWLGLQGVSLPEAVLQRQPLVLSRLSIVLV